MNHLFAVGNRFYICLFLVFPLFFFYQYPSIYIYYYCGVLVNITTNVLLKGILRQARPRKIVSSLPFDEYGMPSGHSQLISFLTVFTSLYYQNQYVTVVLLLLSIYTISERIVNQYHTVLQTIIGSGIGGFIGYFFYKGMVEKNVGELTTKTDDNAFILHS